MMKQIAVPPPTRQHVNKTPLICFVTGRGHSTPPGLAALRLILRSLEQIFYYGSILISS